MFSIWLALSAYVLLEAGITLAKSIQFRKFFESDFVRKIEEPLAWPRVALLAPLKGIDPDLSSNIESWLHQNYPSYRWFFVLDSIDDPVTRLLQDFPSAEILVAGRAVDCGQKVHNLRFAVEQVPVEYEVFAFVDSDARVNVVG
jgi:cellulose synthase/poly-beta-1,6-N-acetylglucosamine synthase-like glycosyltransferase